MYDAARVVEAAVVVAFIREYSLAPTKFEEDLTLKAKEYEDARVRTKLEEAIRRELLAAPGDVAMTG